MKSQIFRTAINLKIRVNVKIVTVEQKPPEAQNILIMIKKLIAYLLTGIFIARLYISVGIGAEPPKITRKPNQFKAPCGEKEGLTIKQRIEECNEIYEKLSTDQTFSLVARHVSKEGIESVYLIDDLSKLVWGPIYNYLDKKNLEDAKNFCKKLNKLGLKWSLPTKIDFLKAGNANNKEVDPDNKLDKNGNQINTDSNKALLKIHVMNQSLWTSSPIKKSNPNGSAWVFGGEYGEFYVEGPRENRAFLCVAQTKI